MASRSTTREDELDEYKSGWAALTQLMDSGSSWSGNERNCSFVNVGDGTFCDVSTLSGFDFLDDGRAVASTDWDGDGRLDLWLRNRTGPQLRFLRGAGRGRHRSVSLGLTGVTCNRDAVGARVEARLGERRVTRTLRAGSGYLAQSSKRLVLGVGDAAGDALDRLTVTWPDGVEQVFEDVPLDRAYELEQGAAELVEVERTKVELAPGALPVPPLGSTRVVLRSRLPFHPDVWRELFGEPGEPGANDAVWIQLWAQWCAPCLVELDAMAERWDELAAGGLRFAALTVDDTEEDRARASAVFEERVRAKVADPAFRYVEPSAEVRGYLQALLEHVLARTDEGALPTGLLVDRLGYLQLLVLGPADVDQLIEDLGTFGGGGGVGVRSGYPGRWFFGTSRDLEGFARALEGVGLDGLAAFYRRFAARQQSRSR